MIHLIDKDVLVAEIERRISVLKANESNESVISMLAGGMFVNEFKDLLSFINSLEVKEVDLYKELDVYFAQFKGLEKSYWNWRIDSINIHAQGIYDFAKHFFELGLKAAQKEK